VAKAGSVEAVVSAMNRHVKNADVQHSGCLALQRLAHHDHNTSAADARIDIDTIVDGLRNHSRRSPERALALKMLARDSAIDGSAKSYVAAAGGIDAILAAMRNHARGSPEVQEECCSALAALARNCAGDSTAIQGAGGVAAIEAAMRIHPSNAYVQRKGASALEALIPEELTQKTQKDERKKRLEIGRVKTLFHQTDATAAAAIVAGQKFKRGNGGSAGGGIYFATSVEATARKAMSHGPVLQADVCLGNVKHISGNDQHITFTSLRDEEFDSVKTTHFQSGPEYIVYNFDQVTNIRYAAKQQQQQQQQQQLSAVVMAAVDSAMAAVLGAGSA